MAAIFNPQPRLFPIDDITEAYKQLRRLVMDYLGISSTTPVSTAAPYTNTNTGEVTEGLGFPG